MAESVSYEKIIKMLGDNYRKIEQSIVNQILLNVSNHHPTEGSYRENVWKSLFEMIVPRKYCIDPVSYTHLDVYKRQVEPGLEDLFLYHFGEETEEQGEM